MMPLDGVMKYDQIKEFSDEEFRRLTGVKRNTFEKMVAILTAAERVVNENVIGSLKRFKIISDRYRNRRKRFGLRFNLVAGIHNLELSE
jgi:hypothetical protein